MPIYEYHCQACDRISEALRKMADADAPMTCDYCSSRKTRRTHSVCAPAASQHAADHTLPMAGPGGCCPCGDPSGPCSR